MFSTNDSIKFMMAKIFFQLANFTYKEYREITPVVYHGSKTLEINYVRNGKGKLKVNDTTYNLERGTYFVIPEFVSYSIIPNEKLNIYSTYLLLDMKSGYKEYIPLTKDFYIGVKKDFDYIFDSLLYEFTTMNVGYNEIVVSNFKTLIVKMLRNERKTGKRLSHWDTNSLQFEIETIITNEFHSITINELADKLHLSVRELQRYLLKNYNKTFNELKTDAKMTFASNKLLYTNIKVSDLAVLVGYSSLEHFSYAFKKYFNLTPLQYRKEKKPKE